MVEINVDDVNYTLKSKANTVKSSEVVFIAIIAEIHHAISDNVT